MTDTLKDDPKNAAASPARKKRKFRLSDMNGMVFALAALSAVIVTSSLSEARFQSRQSAEMTFQNDLAELTRLAHCPLSALNGTGQRATN